MRIINTKVHGIIDYFLGALLVSSPWTFHFREVQSAVFIIVFAGLLTILLAVLTRFETGLLNFIPLKSHLVFDFLSGAFLASSPWLFHFHERIFKPHLVFGLGLIFIATLTDRILYSKLSHDLNQ